MQIRDRSLGSFPLLEPLTAAVAILLNTALSDRVRKKKKIQKPKDQLG